MNDETNLHPWIEPELEARLTALVLGEASDFERDELERLVADRPELGLYRKRLEAMHRMLREVATGESAEEHGEWKLSPERRERLLAQLSGSIRVLEPKSVVVAKRSPWSISSRFLAVAATIAIIGLMLGLMFPASTGALRSKVAKSQWDDDAYANETYGHDRERMRRAVDEGWESPVPADAPFDTDGEPRETSLADRAIRTPAPTSAPPAPPAEPMVVMRSGQIAASTGTVAIGAGGDIDLRVDPNSPTRISVAASGSTSTNVRVGGDFDGRDAGSRSFAAKPVTSTLGGENTYTGGTEISAGSGALAITGPEFPTSDKRRTVETTAGTVERRLAETSAEIRSLERMSGFEFKNTREAEDRGIPQQDSFGLVEGRKSSPYEFGTTDITLGEPVTEINRDLLPPQPPAPAASPKPVAAAPDAGPTVANLETRLKKQGAGTLALNGGTVDLGLSNEVVEVDGFFDHKQKTDAPQSAPSAGENLNFTGDLQVTAGVEAKVNAAKEPLSLGSGGMIAGVSGQEGREGFGDESPAKPEALSRSTGTGVAAGQKGDVSRMGRSVAVEKSMEESLAPRLDLVGSDRTRDQVIRRELPAPVAEEISREKKRELQKTGVSVNATSSFATSSVDVPLLGNLESVPMSVLDPMKDSPTMQMDGFEDAGSKAEKAVAEGKSMSQQIESEVKRDGTGDWGKAPVSKAPIDETVDLGGEISAGYMSDYIFYGTRFQADGKNGTVPTPGTINFGAGVSSIENLTGFFEVAETSSSMDPETAEHLKKMRYFGDGTGAPNDLATEKSGFELPGLQPDKKTFRFTVRAGSERKDAEVEIDEPWTFGRAGEVDPSVADIMALTPQVGKDEHLFTRNFLGGATGLRGFDYRDVAAKDSGQETAVRLDYAAPLDESKMTSEGRFQFTMGASFGDDVAPTAEKPVTPPIIRKPTPAALDETSPSAEPFSTFSLYVSDVSFQLAKSSLASGKWPEAEKIRIEEFVNAFDYGDPVPSMGERVACRIDQGAHPFLQQRNLVRIALRTAEAGRSSGTPLRLTLLLDSSGSMERPDRRATLTRAVATLAGLLGENDRITLVSFARQPRLVADAVAGNEAMKLAETVASLPSEGGTNLEAALELAFEKAREHQEANAQNRIVLLTDGAANLGDAKAESLGARVEMMREAGIAFDAAGFGAEGLNDEILEALTRKGDGRYYLLDRPEDAGEAFAEQIAGALRPAAKNVKVQVEFNPDRVKSYKLLGFEKHRLATEDFRNDAVDAAELAAAEAGVAVYQVEPDPAGEGDLGSVSVRFRDLESGEMIERRWALPHLATVPAADQGGGATHLAIVASQFAAKLAGGPLGDVVDLGELARLAATLPESERVKELRTMIEQARNLEGLSVSF